MGSEIEINDEAIFLLGLCRPSFTSEQAEKLRNLAEKISDWERFTTLANEHGISSLVYSNLEALDLLRLLPESSSGFLQKARMLNISRNAFHITAIEELLSLFNRKGIRMVLLKGMALELTVYGNCGLRQMSDVDILISRNDSVLSGSLMRENGYDSLPLKSGLYKPIVSFTGKHLPSMLKNGLSVDVHLELFPGSKNDLTRHILETGVEIAVEGEKAFIPAPQLFFIFLVNHLHQHEISNESQLRLYADLVFLLGKHYEEIINYELLSMATEAGMSKILAWKLELLRDLWGIRFPEWIDDFIDRWFNPDSVNKFVFFLESPKGNRPERPGYVYRQIIRNVPGFHRKFLFIAGDIFPTVRFMRERYKCKSSFAAIMMYPLRLGKLWLLFSR